MTEMLVLPFYVIVDVSYSMTTPPKSGEGIIPLAAGNQIVRAVKEVLDESPILSDKVRFSLLDFSDDAQVVIPMCDLLKVDPDDIPQLSARGGTSFAAAFDLLKRQIVIDVAQMKAEGHKVHRPAAFFLTDGEPSEDDTIWQGAFSSLTDPGFPARPNVIPFGVAQAQKVVLDQLVHGKGMRSFVAREGEDAGKAITQMAEKLIGSIVASVNSVKEAGESGGFVLPDDDEDEGVWL